ncbi:PLATZ transcription factor family protein [Abeliophyllum distichum]|uniref:PLATZ transcription factor family protein n=1 Tax=Abeliophyllum distichum TaxID=126358 RepID=A0ABD1TZT2_9LAMI
MEVGSLHLTYLRLRYGVRFGLRVCIYDFERIRTTPSFPHSTPPLSTIKLAIDNQESGVREIKPKNRRIMGAGGPDEEDNRWPPWLKPLLKEHFFAYHKDHRAIQIRRSSYHDVIRVSEIQKYLDISSVQTYIINSAKVVFLNERPQPRPDSALLVARLLGHRKNFEKKTKQVHEKKGSPMTASDSEDSYSSSSSRHSHGHGRPKGLNTAAKVRSFSPSTPPPTAVNYRTAKRRKGIPHRAPMGGLFIEY